MRFSSTRLNAAAASSAIHTLKSRDITLRVPCNGARYRLSLCTSRHLLRNVIQRHHLIHTTGAHIQFWQMLGTNLSFTNLLACQMDGEERVGTRFTVEEATIVTEAMALGECRAHIQPTFNYQLIENGKAPFPLSVDRVMYQQPKPFSSHVSADLSQLMSKDCPHGLPELSGMPLEVLQEYFQYNMTLHAYHFLRQSDGSPSAVWLYSPVDGRPLVKAGLLNPHDPTKLTTLGYATLKSEEEVGDVAEESSSEEPAASEDVSPLTAPSKTVSNRLKDALLESIPTSFGLMLTPLADEAGEKGTMELQQRLVKATAALPDHPVLRSFLSDPDFHRHAVQNLLALVTGDMEGSFAVAEKARQCTQDPATLAPLVEAVRQELKFNELALSSLTLDAADTSRCAVDFFCRCSPANFITALKTMDDETFASVSQQPFRCVLCNKVHRLTESDWEGIAAQRSAPHEDSKAA